MVMDRLERLVTLFRRRWSAPLLAELYCLDGAKFVTLVHRTGASGGAVRQTLDELIGRGWVAPNPGYGHPLRPEYILTSHGARVAPACAALRDAVDTLGVAGAALKRWSMPVLYVVGRTPCRFSQIGGTLDGITDRALALTLHDLAGARLVTRRPAPARSAVRYEPTPAGVSLVPILGGV
jgi:DNA-binding HxlR family transcriptional regulator